MKTFALTYRCDWKMPGEARHAAPRRAASGIAACLGLLWLPGRATNDNVNDVYTGRGYVRLASARS